MTSPAANVLFEKKKSLGHEQIELPGEKNPSYSPFQAHSEAPFIKPTTLTHIKLAP
jgi:hypothetical protein